MIDVFFGIAGFGFMLLMQAAIINGVSISFQGYDEVVDGKTIIHGNIFYPIARWFNVRPKFDWIAKPMFKCIKCMASVYGSLTFWGLVIPVFGYHGIEWFVWVCDIFALVYVNYLYFKNI